MADIIDIGFRVQGADQAAEQIKGITNETKKLEGEQKKAETSVKSYAAQIKALRLELISLGERTKENGEAYDNLSQRIRALDDAQEDLLIGTGQLDDQLSALPGPVGRAAGVFKTYDIALKNVRGAKVALIKQFPILKNAIAATGIGALVIVFGLLVGAVIKAFNSFKPLQEAVGRLGVAFELVEKLVQPIINLIGTGLTRAVDFAARSIAFLTGNLEEYNAEIANKKATEDLKSQLNQQAALWELNKDKFTQLEREKGDAYQANLERFKAIDEEEGLSTQQKNERKRASNALYFRDLQRAEQDDKKRKDELAKQERERIKKAKELTQEQIEKIKELNQTTLKALNDQITLLAARGIEQFEGVKQYDELNRRLQFFGSVLENAKTQLERFETQINNFTIKKDEGLPLLQAALDETQKKFEEAFTGPTIANLVDSIRRIDGEFGDMTEQIAKSSKNDLEQFESNLTQIFNQLIEKKDLFVKDIEGPFRSVVRNYAVILEQLKKIGFRDYNELISAVEKRDDAFRKGTRSEELKTQEQLNKIREKFIEQFVQRQIDLAGGQKKVNKDLVAGFQQSGEAAFDALAGNILQIKAFKDGVIEVNKEFKQTETAIEQAFKKGTLDAFIQQDLEGTSLELEKIIEKLITTKRNLDDAFYIGKEPEESIMNQINQLPPALNPILDGIIKLQRENDLLGTSFEQMVDKSKVVKTIPIGEIKTRSEEGIKAIQALVATMGEGFTISAQTAQLLLDKLIERRTTAQVILKQFDTDYLGGQYEQQLAALENQRLLDIQLLKDKQATQEQLTQLEEIYAKRRKQIQGNYNLFVLNSTAQILGNIGGLFGEQTAAFKGLKYFEALITAISSSVQAYNSALQYGGPAGPVLAPILAATTFAVQQKQALKILETPEPDFNTGGGGAGYTGGLLGREGGLVFGRTHEQGGVNAELEGGEFILNRRTMMIPGVADLALRLNNLDPNTTQTQSSSQVVKAYVLSGEMTTAQKADKRIRDLSRL